MGTNDELILMQNVAPPRFPIIVHEWLDQFPGCQFGGVEYTNGLRSPDLTPCDFFLIGPGKLDQNRPVYVTNLN